MSIVKTQQLTKVYRSGLVRKTSVVALNNASITVNAGEVFGLLGPNGAGKTTFVKLLLSIVFPSAGTATVLNKQVGDVQIRERSGYLPENHRYPAFLTGYQTLLLFGTMHGLQQRFLRDKARRLLDLV
jgi:ABC-2 type transport system ATP-binding protein